MSHMVVYYQHQQQPHRYAICLYNWEHAIECNMNLKQVCIVNYYNRMSCSFVNKLCIIYVYIQTYI